MRKLMLFVLLFPFIAVAQSNTFPSSGNVGIGTTAPTVPLHIKGSQIIETSGFTTNSRTLTIMQSGTSQILFGAYNGSWRSSLQIQNNDATKGLFIAPPEVGYHYAIFRSVNGGIKLDVGGDYSNFGTNALTIEPDGSMGIGTTASGSEALSITNNGNVGIGTTTPTSKLTVAGDIHSRKVKVTVNAGADFVFKKDYELKKLEELQQYIQQQKHLPDIPSAKEMETMGIDLGEMNVKLLQKIEELTLYIIEQNKKIELQQKKLEEFQDIKKEWETIKSKLQKQ